jgi:hypothetical protein
VPGDEVMKLNKLITAAALLMAAAPALAANWVYLLTDDQGAEHYYDTQNLLRSGNYITVWTKSDHSRDKTVKIRERMTRSKYDCAGRTITNLVIVFYYPDGKNETVNYPPYQQTARSIIPDTIAEKQMEAVCGRS